ncbi:MAG: Rid family detoxifying hydrolase [Anaerovoracaceae bacterium]|jgi:2-iminobutanoate/2-iminopropanoate deaminase
MEKKVIATNKAPAALGAYSQGILLDNGLVYTSGQLGIDPETGEFADGIEAQTRQALDNVKAILETAGSSMDKAVKISIFISDMGNFSKIDAEYKKYFSEGCYPARSVVEVACLPKNGMLEVEAIALV